MQIIITSADVFSDLDAEHPFGTVRRPCGGVYLLDPADGAPSGFLDYDSAITQAGKIIDEVEADPSTELKRALARIVVLETKLRDAGVEIAVDAVPVSR